MPYKEKKIFRIKLKFDLQYVRTVMTSITFNDNFMRALHDRVS